MTKSKQKEIIKTIPELAKENGQTIRTIFQIIKELLKLEDEEEIKCSQCGFSELEIEIVRPDADWYDKHIRQKSRNKSPTKGVKILVADPSLPKRKGKAMSQAKRNEENLW